jgi:hypothetical protein
MTAVELDEVPQAASVETAAAAFDKVGPAVDDFRHAVTSAWARLAEFGVYDAPESPQVVSALADSMRLASTIGEDAGGVKTALAAYATTLADLASRRGALATDKAVADAVTAAQLMGSGSDALADSDDGGDDVSPSSVNRRVTDFNAEIEEADEVCAEALLKLLRYPGDAAVDTMAGIGDLVGENKVAFAILGTQEVLRLSPELKNLYSAITASDDLSELAETYRSPLAADAKASFAKLLSLKSLTKPFEFAENGIPLKLEGGELKTISMTPVESAKGLIGGAGAVIAGGVATAEQWDKDEADHADWNPLQRSTHAGMHGVAVAAGSAVGASVGADVGEIAGAVVGEAMFPLGGAFIGGFVGGVVGGFIGSKIGEGSGNGAADLVDSFFHW